MKLDFNDPPFKAEGPIRVRVAVLYDDRPRPWWKRILGIFFKRFRPLVAFYD